jgi:hypothetical protein
MQENLALTVLGKTLQARGYRFVAVTPATHCRVLDRAPPPVTLESIFGWNRPFDREALDPEIFDLLEDAEALGRGVGSLQVESALRHYRRSDLRAFGIPHRRAGRGVFRTLIPTGLSACCEHRLPTSRLSGPVRLIDIGSGSGAGLELPQPDCSASAPRLSSATSTARRLAFSAVNAIRQTTVASAKTVFSDVLGGIEGPADVIMANAPYLVDDDRRLYRHGGGELGISLTVRIAEEGLDRLKPGGRLILYSGTPIVGGADPLLEVLEPVLKLNASHFVYGEIDPDVFGEELDRQAYANADRIAAIGLTAVKRG